jgi:hypothetical protein
MEKQVYETPEPLKKLEPGLPPRVYQVVEKLIRKRPDERYASASDLVEELEAAREQILVGVRDESASRISPSTSRSRPGVRPRRRLFRRFFG